MTDSLPASTDQDRADQERIAAYVRRALPRELERRGIPWPVGADYFDRAIFASLRQGPLRLEQGVTYGDPLEEEWGRTWEGRPHRYAPWWYPCRKENAQRITGSLGSGSSASGGSTSRPMRRGGWR